MRARVKDSGIPREGIDSFEAADTLFTVLTHAEIPD